KAARFAEASGGEGAALLGNPRADARHRASNAGGEGARTGCGSGAHRKASGGDDCRGKPERAEHPATGKRTGSTQSAHLSFGCGTPAKPKSTESDSVGSGPRRKSRCVQPATRGRTGGTSRANRRGNGRVGRAGCGVGGAKRGARTVG